LVHVRAYSESEEKPRQSSDFSGLKTPLKTLRPAKKIPHPPSAEPSPKSAGSKKMLRPLKTDLEPVSPGKKLSVRSTSTRKLCENILTDPAGATGADPNSEGNSEAADFLDWLSKTSSTAALSSPSKPPSTRTGPRRKLSTPREPEAEKKIPGVQEGFAESAESGESRSPSISPSVSQVEGERTGRKKKLIKATSNVHVQMAKANLGSQ
jgi:hypothetical protein